MRFGRQSWVGMRTALALAAMLVQAAIPLLIAAEIAAASGTVPICRVATDDHKSGPQTPGHPCPICAAVAASAAFIATAPPVVSPSQLVIAYIFPTSRHKAPTYVFAAAYQSRAPPLA